MSNTGEFVIEKGVLVKYIGTELRIIVPAGVSAIGSYAFAWNSNILSVFLPESVTEIGDSSFKECKKLQRVYVKGELTSIGNSAFNGCEMLERIEFPSSLFVIGRFAFMNCRKLTDVTGVPLVKKIGTCAFFGCEALQDSEGFTCVDGVLYDYFGTEKKAVLPENVQCIEEYAFNRNKELELHIMGTPEIKRDALRVIKRIVAPKLPLSVFSSAAEKRAAVMGFLLNYALYKDEKIAETYKKYAFSQKKRLLPEIFKEDSAAAIQFFADNNKITIKNFDEDFFTPAENENAVSCTAVLLNWRDNNITFGDIEKNMERELNKDPFNAEDMKKLWSFEELSDGTVALTSYKGNETEIFIPSRIGRKKVTRLSDGLFGLRFKDGRRKPKDRRKVLVNITSVIIPETVTEIGRIAFCGCKSLTSVKIPDSVRSIEEYAFYECTRLKEVNLPDSVTELGEGVFLNCKALKNENGFVIFRDILYNYYGMREHVTVPGFIREIGGYAFYGLSQIKGVTIPPSVVSVGESAFAWCRNLESISLPDSVTFLGAAAFEWCRKLKAVSLSESITSIGTDTFSECDSLTDVIIPASAESIGKKAFWGCENLKSIIIPPTVKKIDNTAFLFCKNLTVYSTAGSAAETFARKKEIPFSEI